MLESGPSPPTIARFLSVVESATCPSVETRPEYLAFTERRVWAKQVLSTPALKLLGETKNSGHFMARVCLFPIFLQDLRSLRGWRHRLHCFLCLQVDINGFKLKCIRGTQLNTFLRYDFSSLPLWPLNDHPKSKVHFRDWSSYQWVITKLILYSFSSTDISCKHRWWSSLTSETSLGLWGLNQYPPPHFRMVTEPTPEVFLPPVWKDIKIPLHGSSLYTWPFLYDFCKYSCPHSTSALDVVTKYLTLEFLDSIAASGQICTFPRKPYSSNDTCAIVYITCTYTV